MQGVVCHDKDRGRQGVHADQASAAGSGGVSSNPCFKMHRCLPPASLPWDWSIDGAHAESKSRHTTSITNLYMQDGVCSTCKAVSPCYLSREAEAIGGGAHARKRRVAGHMRALLSRADATTQVGAVVCSVVALHVRRVVLRSDHAYHTKPPREAAPKPLYTLVLMLLSLSCFHSLLMLRARLHSPSPLCLRGQGYCLTSALFRIHAGSGEVTPHGGIQEVRALHGLCSALLKSTEAPEDAERLQDDT